MLDLVSDRPSRTLAGGRVDLRCPLRGGPGSLGSVLIVSSCGGCGAWPINQLLALIAISLIGVASYALGNALALIGLHRVSIRLLPPRS